MRIPKFPTFVLLPNSKVDTTYGETSFGAVILLFLFQPKHGKMKEGNSKPRSRNKENTRQRLLDAVGEILRSKGYHALKVNQIAATAGVDKKLIYNYFGSKDNLVGEYVNSKDFWSNVTSDSVPADFSDGGKKFTIEVLQQQFDFVKNSAELQKVLLWRLSEEQPFLKLMTENQEKVGEELFKHVMDPYFRENAQTYRAITAILVAGMYYLNLYASHNGSVFCGIDLSDESGREKIRQALSFLINKTYDGLQESGS